MLLLVLLALLVVIFIGAGFAIHLLWIIAVIAALLWLISFFVGGAFAGVFILLFSLIGIYGLHQGLADGTPATVSNYIGLAAFTFTNMISLTSSISVIDSSCSSMSKLWGLEVFGVFTGKRATTAEVAIGSAPPAAPGLCCGKPVPAFFGKPLTYHQAKPINMLIGRIMIFVLCVCGTLMLLQGESALDATTISGTVVLGLGPPVWALIVMKGHRPLAFHLPFWFGVIIGIVYQVNNSWFNSWAIGNGGNGTLLGLNIYGYLIAIGLFAIGCLWNPGDDWRLLVQEGRVARNPDSSWRLIDDPEKDGVEMGANGVNSFRVAPAPSGQVSVLPRANGGAEGAPSDGGDASGAVPAATSATAPSGSSAKVAPL